MIWVIAMTFYYFAYGSNMLTERLKARNRCPGATVCGCAFAEGAIIEFSKRSVDGSGKATLGRAVGQHTPGVLFKIPNSESYNLDRAEGAGNGYHRCEAFPVRRFGSEALVEAVTYIAKSPKAHLKPYDWYLALVIAGAKQHSLGDDYIAKLRREPYTLDECSTRDTRKEAIVALRAAGFPDYRELLG
ncbi:MAG: gamma-glutamylcyclotransferase [Gammaproteobacteria bacterium]|nr:gamma-glutamylcyclotransferase [Gammaproteobacteria bacterium]